MKKFILTVEVDDRWDAHMLCALQEIIDEEACPVISAILEHDVAYLEE